MRKQQKFSTLNQVIFTSLLSVLVIFSLMILLVTKTLHSYNKDIANQTDAECSEHITSSLNNNLNYVASMLKVIQQSFSEFDYKADIADTSVKKILVDILELTPNVHGAWFIFDKGAYSKDDYYVKEYLKLNGVITRNENPNIYEQLNNPEESPWYFEPLRTGAIYFDSGDLYDYGVGAELISTLSIPIRVNGEIIGVCGVDMLYEDIFVHANKRVGQTIILLNQEMKIIYASDGSLTSKMFFDFSFEDADMMRGVIKQNAESVGVTAISPFSGKKSLISLRPVLLSTYAGDCPLYLYFDMPLSALYANSNNIALLFIVASSVSMLLIIGIILLNMKKILRPIKELTAFAQHIAAGNLIPDYKAADYPFPPPNPYDNRREKSEIAVLQLAFAKMLHTLDENLNTVEKRVEERTRELQELNNYLKLLMENASDIFILFDYELKVVYCSSNILELIKINGFSDITGKSLVDIHELFTDWNYIERSAYRFARIRSGDDQLTEEDSLCWPVTGRRSYRITYRRTQDEQSSFSGIVVIMYDITEVKQEELRLRTSDILNSTLLPCVVWDQDGNITAYNSRAAHIFDIKDDLSFADFNESFLAIQPERQPDGRVTEDIRQKAIGEALEKGFARTIVQLKKSDGTPIDFEISAARTPWQSDFRLVVYFYDLTDIRAMEASAKEAEEKMLENIEQRRALELQKEAAQAASEAKGQFLARMSHEIRTPMNAILGISELLLEENLNKRQIKYAKDIKISVTTLLDIINDILDLSKIQADKFTLKPVHYNLGALIDNVASMVNFLIRDKSVVFKLDIQNKIPECLYGDNIRLRQALLNILGNAVKFTNEGSVRLTVSATDATIAFAVIDTGIGIPSGSLSTIFEAFEQVDSLKTRYKKGTGLGLPITKNLVEMMDGQITVESAYGQGSTFTITIPKILGDESLIIDSNPDEKLICAPSAKVLVVDDNTINLNVACGLLRLFKIMAKTAGSGPQAIELIRKNQYDIVFMDHMMPEMDGVETTKIVRDMGINVPIVALTANVMTGVREMLLASGIDDFLPKPIIKASLNQMLKKWLPAEKLIASSDKADRADRYETEKFEEFWDKVEELEGLSMQTGLGMVSGQMDVYKKSLRLLIKEAEKCAVNLNGFLVAGDMRNFSIAAHGMKGSLANIGATELSNEARELEVASARSDSAFCASNLPRFLEELNKLSFGLKEAFSAIKQSGVPSNIPPELPQIFRRMTDAFAEIDIVIIDKELKRLNALDLNDALKEEIEQIRDAVLVMDYEEAESIIHKLLNNSFEREK